MCRSSLNSLFAPPILSLYSLAITCLLFLSSTTTLRDLNVLLSFEYYRRCFVLRHTPTREILCTRLSSRKPRQPEYLLLFLLFSATSRPGRSYTERKIRHLLTATSLQHFAPMKTFSSARVSYLDTTTLSNHQRTFTPSQASQLAHHSFLASKRCDSNRDSCD